MKKQFLIPAIFTLITIFAFFHTEGRGDSLFRIDVDRTGGPFSIDAEGARLMSGVYLEIYTLQGVMSASNGSLVAGELKGPSAAKNRIGESEIYSIPYSDASGKLWMEIEIKTYPNKRSLAIGYKYAGGRALIPDGGLRLIIGGMPGFVKGMGAERFSQFWTKPAFAAKPGDFPKETQYVLWEDSKFNYGAMIPLVGGGMRSTFSPVNGKISVFQQSFDAGFKPKESQLLALAVGSDPYETTHNVYDVGMEFMGDPARLRIEKNYPELFNYIGWCSWNAYYHDVDQEKVLANARSFKEHKFPVGYFVIDDGWQDEKDRKLVSFDIIRSKFPDGIEGLTSKLKKEYGIKWVGFWHAYQGYWNGVNPDSELAVKYKKALFRGLTGALIPDPEKERGFEFYNGYHSYLKERGADLVKVDNQSTLSVITMNRIPVGYAARGQQTNLQKSVMKNFDGAIINCMDMTIENIYFWKDTNIGRNSDDFFPKRPDNFQIHALHNIYNSLWFSELTYPDFDMFESNHPQAKAHSVLRSISGGPLYFTDAAGKENYDILRKLVFSDGRLPRADQPAKPTRDVLFVNPVLERNALKAFTVANGSGIIAAFNVDQASRKVKGKVSPTDVEGIAGEEFALYEHFSGKVKKMKKSDASDILINPNDVRLFVVAPMNSGFAVIGALDKYISPKWVGSIDFGKAKIKITLVEGCEFGAYMDTKPKGILINGKKAAAGLWSYQDNLLKVKLSDVAEKIAIEIER